MATDTTTLNTGASQAGINAAPAKNQYTQEFFLQNVFQNVADVENKQSQVAMFQYPHDIGRYYMSIDMSDYHRTDLLSIAVLNTTHLIKFPMPKQMNDSHGVTYEQKELNQAVGSVTSSAMDATVGNGVGTSGILNSFASAAGLAATTLSHLVEKFTGVPVEDALRAASGLAPNQFLTVLLKGPQYKKHSFSWTLSPRNAAESETLRQIIANLNEAMAPGFATQNFFSFPKVFELSFAPTPTMLYRFLPAVLETMNINYAPSGPSFYAGTDAPAAIELTLNFLELEFWLSGRGQYQV